MLSPVAYSARLRGVEKGREGRVSFGFRVTMSDYLELGATW